MCFLKQEKIPEFDICILAPRYGEEILNLSYGRMPWQYFQFSGTAVLRCCSSNEDAHIERTAVF
jgi:hypothetical protein